MSDLPKSDEFFTQIDHKPPKLTGWMDAPLDIRKVIYCYASNPKSVETLSLPYARPWNPLDDDWHLPENWQQIIHEGLKERLKRFRSFKIFMDICVRCGACGVQAQDQALTVFSREIAAAIADAAKPQP